MKFELPDLPYALDALEPFISAETLEVHYKKHHAGYVSKLDAALEESPLRDKSLEEIVLATSGDTFNLAAQVWNHNFYWASLAPTGQSLANFRELEAALKRSFDDLGQFEEAFQKAAAGQFGSGWAWLTCDENAESLAVTSTSDAGNPMLDGRVPLLTLDVWEHAYYLDYKNEREAYIKAFLNEHLNWSFAAENFAAARQRKVA